MATFTVTNTNNTGAGSLRQAVLNANALTGKNIINFGGLFDDGLAHTISLTGSSLSITDDITIQGTNPNLLTIKDDSATRVFDISKGATAAINGLTITNSYKNGINNTNNYSAFNGAAGGGGISNEGVLILSNSIITGNTAQVGGGIYSAGTITLNNSIITGNTASDGGITGTPNFYYDNNSDLIYYGSGGGIFNTGNLTVYHSTITNNTAYDGGGIFNVIPSASLTLSVSNSSISDNSASFSGGGIYYLDSYNIPLGTITVSNSTISGNSALKGSGGGIYDGLQGNGVYDQTGTIIDTTLPTFPPSTITVTVTNSIINDNSAGTDGGGIYNYSVQFPPNSVSNTITLSKSIISGNSAGTDGGGIYNGGFTYPSYKDSDRVAYGNLTAIYSTINENYASSGGGIYNNGTLSLSNSTISDNYARDYGGGIYNSSFNEFSILNPAGPFYPAYMTTYNILGIVTVSHSSILDNRAGTAGGGIYNNPDQDFGKTVKFTIDTASDAPITYNGLGIVNVSNSTISDNQAHFGAGIYNNSTLTVGNSTIKHNKAFGIELSSGVYQSGDGGGIYNNSTYGGTTTVDYSAIACNFDTPFDDSTRFIKHDDVAGKFINKGHNSIGTTTSTTTAGDALF